MKRILVFLGLLVLSSCTTSLDEDKLIHINAGDSMAKVQKIMGPPDKREFQGNIQVWQWCQSGFLTHTYASIQFLNSKVIKLVEYTHPVRKIDCASHFQEVDWSDDPDQTIEIRNR